MKVSYRKWFSFLLTLPTLTLTLYILTCLGSVFISNTIILLKFCRAAKCLSLCGRGGVRYTPWRPTPQEVSLLRIHRKRKGFSPNSTVGLRGLVNCFEVYKTIVPPFIPFQTPDNLSNLHRSSLLPTHSNSTLVMMIVDMQPTCPWQPWLGNMGRTEKKILEPQKRFISL